VFRDIFQNISLVAAVVSWLAAQVIKLLLFIAQERKFDYGFLFRLGGMPSSHTSSAAACAASVGLRSGFGSPVFAVATGLLMLIMIDAQSVRRAAGVQARLLNQMAEEFYRNHKFSPEKLVEFLGHTRLEVLIGLVLGIMVALFMHQCFPEWAAACPA
jgi:acid phosphatase family membrane protein YuiD